MPKKFQGENSKANVARARKAAKIEEEETRKKQELEDEYWKDDDKHASKKQQRKEDKQKKHEDLLERKKANQDLLEEEMLSLKSGKPAPSKLTRAELAANKERMEAAAAAKPAVLMHDQVPLEENVNRSLGAEGEARSVDDAISVLSVKDEQIDLHPEKRVKAAYQEYEKRRLPILKVENSNLRLSQLKQIIKKEWMKSPENPLNQRQAAYDMANH